MLPIPYPPCRLYVNHYIKYHVICSTVPVIAESLLFPVMGDHVCSTTVGNSDSLPEGMSFHGNFSDGRHVCTKYHLFY